MSALAIVLIVLVVVVGVLFVLGLLGARRHREATGEEFKQRLEQANTALADARAVDRGWDLSALEEAARAAVGRRSPDATVRGVHLVQIIDRPGTDDDEARFHVDIARGRDYEVVLHRTGDTWSELQGR